MIGMCERENGKDSTVFVCLTCLWKHMASVCNCYCCGDHDGWIIVLYTPSTLHCWKVLFIYLWVCEDESSTSGLILYPQRNRLFSWCRLDFIQQSGPQAPPFTNSWKKSVSKCVPKFHPKIYNIKMQKNLKMKNNPSNQAKKQQKWCSSLLDCVNWVFHMKDIWKNRRIYWKNM